MFFRKAKRIKELEAKNDSLEKEIIKMRALLARESLKFEIDTPTIETYQSVIYFHNYMSKETMESVVKNKLGRELYPLMKIEFDYIPMYDEFMARASIRVVKEAINGET